MLRNYIWNTPPPTRWWKITCIKLLISLYLPSFALLFVSLKICQTKWIWVFVNNMLLFLCQAWRIIFVFCCFSVDDLEKCSSMVGSDQKQILASKLRSNFSSMPHTRKKIAAPKKYYPFKQGHLAIAILRIGAEGIHMSVDGKHVTSFAFREASLL